MFRTSGPWLNYILSEKGILLGYYGDAPNQNKNFIKVAPRGGGEVLERTMCQ